MAKITALKCPSCSANISLNTKKCEYCGTELVISPDRTALILAGQEDCPKCKYANPKGQWFCSQCGAVVSTDVRIIERQKREKFLQNQAREELPKDLLDKLDPNEYLHHYYYSKDRFYYVITDKKLVAWFHSPKILFSKEKKDLWELKYGDIAYINDPQSRRDFNDNIAYNLEIGTYSKEKKILDFGRDSSAIWNFKNELRNAYSNHLDHRTDINARICFADLEGKNSTKTTIDTCSTCGKAMSNFPKDIIFCPYCGKQLEK
jgi:predicted RNA-binding Zn-ribbon protein involved in translation (DUF1610 family)